MATLGNKRAFHAMTIACAVAFIGVCVAAGLTGGVPRMGLPFAFLALVWLSESFAVELPKNVTISPQALFVMGAVVLFGTHPGAVLGCALTGAVGGVAIASLRRRSVAVVVFNVAQFGLSAAAASVVYQQCHSLPAIVGLLAAPLAYNVVNGFVVTTGVALESGLSPRAVWTNLSTAVLADLVFSVSGICLAYLYRRSGAIVIPAVLAPAVVARLVYAVIGRSRRALERVDILYGFIQKLEGTNDERGVIAATLDESCERLRARSAELTVIRGERWERTANTAGTSTSEEGSGRPVEAEAMVAGPLLSSALSSDSPLRRALVRRSMHDAMVAPLRLNERLLGTLVVADRRSGLRFGTDDLRLLETLAGHAAVSLANGRLMDRLRWDSTHDRLTGLRNQEHFDELIASTPSPCAVLVVDLDRFKEINDALGHDVGNRLLCAVADRLVAVAPAGATVARMGGDQFGVLVPGATTDDVPGLALQLLGALDDPFVVEILDVEITASVGAAVANDHVKPTELYQRADVAMYSAKSSHSGWELYSPTHSHHAPGRVNFASELRRAIDCNELAVHYQPKVEMSSVRVTGVEALVRWQHPRFGLLPPDAFIPLAEGAGLIRPITDRVLRQAAAQHRELRARGFDLNVAVNLSVRSVLDVDLPDQVSELFGTHGIDPSKLTVEVTEGSVMSDPSRTIGVLNRLADLGVGVALDDFGTGYSSLAYLKRLPATEIKMDRSFVFGMRTNSKDEAIVRSTIDLAHHLSIRVVAEGVEDHWTWARLAALGCDEGQGFVISPPLAPDALHGWLERSPASSDLFR